MISESSKETVPEFYFTSFIILLTQLEISIFKNWMDVLLSIKQNKNVKNMSFVIFYTDIVSNIFFWGGDFRCDDHHRDSFHMLQHSIVHFFHMNN